MQDSHRKVSAGTIVMLAMTVLVLIGTAYVLLRLSSGKTIDLSRLRPGVLELENNRATEPDNSAVPKETPETTSAEKPSPPPENSGRRTVTLTAAGSTALNGEVRKNSYSSEVKAYDYYDVMMLLKKELQSDLNLVFLENLMTEDGKVSDTYTTIAAASMLKTAGFHYAACGFSKAFDGKETGIAVTRKLLGEFGITPVGIYETEEESHGIHTEINGIRIALLQYTDTVASATRKSMDKQGISHMIPPADPELIAEDIAWARSGGAEAVIVLLEWGKTGKAPEKSMRTLAQQIADAGADLIIGNGSLIVSGTETLISAADGKYVLCVWSLGATLTGDRSNIKRIAGMLLHVTLAVEDGRTTVREFRYTPLYTWKFKQDGRFYYRCLAANGTVPDGMDSDQQKMMQKAAESVRDAMKDSPAGERKSE